MVIMIFFKVIMIIIFIKTYQSVHSKYKKLKFALSPKKNKKVIKKTLNCRVCISVWGCAPIFCIARKNEEREDLFGVA